MPDAVAAGRQRQARQLVLAGRIEEAELQTRRVGRPDRDVQRQTAAIGQDLRAHRPGLAGAQQVGLDRHATALRLRDTAVDETVYQRRKHDIHLAM